MTPDSCARALGNTKTIFNTYGLSSPKNDLESVPDFPAFAGVEPNIFNRKYAPLRKDTNPVYHVTLEKLGLEKLSWKIHQCGIDGVKLRCSDDVDHEYVVPVLCQRRTCPECVRREIGERYKQFSGLETIIRRANDAPGDFYPKSWRVRFFTLTMHAVKGGDLRIPIEAGKKALFHTWRNIWGERSNCGIVRRGEHTLKTAGLFFMEIQSGWNVHFHGLVLAPFVPVQELRSTWQSALKKNNWRGEWVYVKNLEDDSTKTRKQEDRGKYSNALYELLSYPIKPNKEGRHEETLLANVEYAMKGFRRFVTKGDWYNNFPEPEHSNSMCPVCNAPMTMFFDKNLEYVFGKTYQKGVFSYDENGVNNFHTLTREALAKENYDRIHGGNS